MKNVPVSFIRLFILTVLGLSVSACVTTDTSALYYTPTPSVSHQIYGYNAVDFQALNVDH